MQVGRTRIPVQIETESITNTKSIHEPNEVPVVVVSVIL
jgi:hypothetical protein